MSDSKNIPTDQAAPELLPCPFCGGDANLNDFTNAPACAWVLSHKANGCIIRIVERYGSKNTAIAAWNRRADLAAPSAPAEVEGLVAALRVKGRHEREQVNHHIRRMEVERIEAATALTALQAENERLKKNLFVWRDRAVEEEARAEKAESERDSAEEREFNRGYLIACCNLTNLHDMPEVGFDVLRELGLSKAQIDGFGLSEYDAEALRNIEKSRSGSVYVDDASAKLKGDV